MLPQDLRLPSIEIAPLLRQGKRIRAGSVEFVFRKTEKGRRFAFIVSTKVEKRATARNRVKRLLREAVAAHIAHIIEGVDGVLVVKGKTPDEYTIMNNLVLTLLKDAGVIQL